MGAIIRPFGLDPDLEERKSDMSSVENGTKHRRAVWLAVGGALVVVIAVAAIVLLNRTPDQVSGTPVSSTTGSAPSTQSSAESPSPSPTGETSTGPTKAGPTASKTSPSDTGSPTVVPTKSVETTTVPLDKKAKSGKDITVSVVKFEDVKGKAQGPGEIAGPALRVTVEVVNGSTERLPMDLALVNLYYGKDKTPASGLSGPGAKPLTKPVGAGASATGRYVFGVPKNEQKRLTVEFSYTTDAPTVVFSGSR